MKLESNKVLLAASSGGHLLQLLTVAEALEAFEKVWVCFDRPDAQYFLKGENVYWCHHPTTRNLWNFIRNGFQAIRVLLKERPAIVLSSGALIAVPYLWLGHFFGAKVVFIEAFNRVRSRSWTGRFVYPVADLFCVQWHPMLKLYPKAEYIGPLQ